MQKIVKEFQQIDINSDNRISRDEFEAHLRRKSMGTNLDLNFVDELSNKMFTNIDRDGNGFIDLQEMIDFYTFEIIEMSDQIEVIKDRIRDNNLKYNEIETKKKELQKTEKPLKFKEGVDVFHPYSGHPKGPRKVMVGSIYSVHVINAQSVDGGELARKANYVVRCEIDKQKYFTTPIFNSLPLWNEILSFDIT